MFAVRRQRDRTHVISMIKSVIGEGTLPACCDRHLANRACCSRMLRPHARCVRSPFVVVRRLSFLICALFIAGTASVYAQKRSITEKDGKPEPPQLSILSMAGGDSFAFTDLPKGASNPVWAPDGKTIAFMSETNADDLAKQERKRKEQELKKTVEQSSPSPHPTSVAGIVDAGQQTAATKKAEIEPEHESDVRVITRAIYREDNEGYAD